MAIGREKLVPCHRFGKGGGKVEPLQGSIGLTCEIAFRLAPEDLRRRAAFRDPTRQLSLAAVWGHEPRNHFFHTCVGGAEIVFPEGEERRQAFPHFLLDMRHRRAQAFVEGDAFRPAQIQPGQGGEGRVVIGVVGPFGHLGVFGEKQVLRCQLHRSARLICEAALQPNALRQPPAFLPTCGCDRAGGELIPSAEPHRLARPAQSQSKSSPCGHPAR